MEQTKILSIRSDFSEYPGPRYIKQGEHSGEEFYYSALNQAFANAVKNKVKLEIILDGTAGFASSFLDESFGNLAYDFTAEFVRKNIVLTSIDEPDWVEMIQDQTFVEWEKRRTKKDIVTVSELPEHDWWRLVDGGLEQGRWPRRKVE